MSHIRAFIKLLVLLVFTLISFILYAIGLLPIKVLRFRYEPWRNFFMHTWAEGVAFIFNMDIIVDGQPPKVPFFIVSNHLSYLDIIPLYLNLRCTFVAKKAVRNWPVLGFMVNAVGVIFVDRTKRTDVRRVNEKLSTAMNKYQGLILFPEGTSSGGEAVLPFHTSLLQFPAMAEVPVHVASISYETGAGDEHARDSVCFFGARHSLPEHLIKLARTRYIRCRIRFSDVPVQSGDRKELARRLYQNVKEIFVPTS